MIEMVVHNVAGADAASLSEDLEILGLWREPLHDDLQLLRVLARSDKTEGVIQDLESKFQATPGFRMVIFEVEATLPAPKTEPEPEGDDEKPKDSHRIAIAELVQKLGDSAEANRIFFLTIVVSTVVAAIGLLRDNVAVIIGAMVIAPLLGPNMTLSLATTLGDSALAKKALNVNLLGLLLALAIAAVIGIFVDSDVISREIQSRTVVSLSDIVLALSAGIAGALAFTTGLSATLIGVMVAVALLPPLTTTGLMLGAGQWQVAVGAFMLTAANIICINLAGVGTFLWQGVKPRYWWDEPRAKRMTRIAATVWVLLLSILVALILYSHK
jgi:uncharacterized hydrophobic protein (TIGR00341 family)